MGFIKGGQLLGQLNNYQLLKKYSIHLCETHDSCFLGCCSASTDVSKLLTASIIAGTFETSENFYRFHGATTQTAAIFFVFS